MLRWSIGLVVPGWWGVLAANVLGSLVLGVLTASPLGDSKPWMALLGTGLMGGFTTYSTFNLGVVEAVGRQAWGEVALQLGVTVVSCLLGGLLGLWLGGLLPRG